MSEPLKSYDVIVIGGRCAGSPLAMLLARQGHSVLLVERGKIATDTLSTHFLWPRAMSYLTRWGIAERVAAVTPTFERLHFVLEGESFITRTPAAAIERRLADVHGSGEGVTTHYACIRRRLLDPILFEAAREAGVATHAGSLEELLWDGDRVVGARLRGSDGSFTEVRSSVVVGADGRSSTVARLVGAAIYDEDAEGTCAYWTYYSGFDIEVPTIQKRGRFAMAIIPTNFGRHMTLVWGPKSWFSSVREDIEGVYLEKLREVSPHWGDVVARRGRREEKFFGTAEQTAYRRQSAGAGWCLVGDAASFKDQCGAIGITHAFRDAELAAREISHALREGRGLDAALGRYAADHEADLAENFAFVGAQAKMLAPTDADRAFYAQLAKHAASGDAFMAAYGDSLPVSRFFTELKMTEEKMTELETLALSGNCTDFARPAGRDLLARTETYFEWWKARQQTATWQYSRTLSGPPGPRAALYDEMDRAIHGTNFASQDYLALGQHPAVHEAAARALRDFGPHSAGSPMVIGNTALSRQLEAALADFLQAEHVVLFPTGWAAGFGTITGLVREYDHVVMDRLSHACLQAGVWAATKNVHRHDHLDVESARAQIAAIRARDAQAGILVVSEGLFSMDADSPDLDKLQRYCHELGATLFVDVAHDLGATGPGGTGQVGIQRLLGKVDLVMGSFSKTFGSNGGFLATRSPAVAQYLKMYGNPHLFSNALSPVQSAVVSKALEIVRSPEGLQLRESLLAVVNAMRAEFRRHGIEPFGNPSPIIPVPIGEEAVSRLAHRRLTERHIAAMIIEYPLVAIGSARFRLQVMANHTVPQGITAAREIAAAVRDAREELGDRRVESRVAAATR